MFAGLLRFSHEFGSNSGSPAFLKKSFFLFYGYKYADKLATDQSVSEQLRW